MGAVGDVSGYLSVGSGDSPGGYGCCFSDIDDINDMTVRMWAADPFAA